MLKAQNLDFVAMVPRLLVWKLKMCPERRLRAWTSDILPKLAKQRGKSSEEDAVSNPLTTRISDVEALGIRLPGA